MGCADLREMRARHIQNRDLCSVGNRVFVELIRSSLAERDVAFERGSWFHIKPDLSPG